MDARIDPHDHTSKEFRTSSTVGHIISGSPCPRGSLSSEQPADIEAASSAIHFSSNEPREENCMGKTSKIYIYNERNYLPKEKIRW